MQSTRATIHLSVFFAGILLVMTGFLFSRALLSIGTFTLIANGFLQNDLKERWSVFLQHKVLIGISCLFLFPLLSGLWSEDKTEWLNALLTKLPLLLLPFALVMQKGFERKQFIFFSLLWAALLFGGTIWSILQYLQQKEQYDLLYRFSKTIPTLADNDHIRFSMAIIIAMLLWLKLEEWKVISSSVLLWSIRAVMAWFVLFLHVLGAKTGLLGLYLIVFPVALWQLYASGKKQLAVVSLVIALLLPVFAYQLLPTFKTRIHYVLYDRDNRIAGNISGDFSDGNRILSIRSGWYVFQQNRLAGVGYGDIKTETNKWYNEYAPAVPLSERFLPLNQWVTSGSGGGIAAALLFTVVILLPFFSKQWLQNRQAIAFILFMNIIFLYECTIDDQFGVYLYSFFILYWHSSNRFKF
jgi:O-antigen ligase